MGKLYVQSNPRGRRQAGTSKKALAIRSSTPHFHVVKKEDEPIPTKRIEATYKCRVMPNGYCLDHLEHHHWGW